MVAPPVPFLPEDAHGQLVIMALVCYAGEADEGQRALAPFRALARPIADLVRPMAYREIYEMGPPPPPPLYDAARSFFLEDVDGDAADSIVEHVRASKAQMAVAQLRVLGGAIARVPADATAFAHRDRRIMVALGAIWEDAGESSEHEAWVSSLARALDPGKPGVYVNFVGDEGEGRVHEAYPGDTWDRLARVKAEYDPTNLFHLNQNIEPRT
jgi:FAD/FMN-containing dehydrogenase